MKLTLEDKMKIIELRKQGLGYKTIAKKINIAFSRIKIILAEYEKHGIEGIKHPPKNRKYSVELKLEIIRRVFDGESKTSLAAEYNLPGAGTIVSWMKKYEELGYNGLEGKQGRPRGRPKIMTKEEKKNTPLTNDEREELIRLRKEKEYLEMENEYLKKLDALVKERLKQQKRKK
jgi:transposase-like protein